MYDHISMGPLDRFDSAEVLAKKIIDEKNAEIDRLKGLGMEEDAEICKKIREWMKSCTDAADMNNLSAALVNMRKVMEDRK